MFASGRADKQDLRDDLLQRRRARSPETIEAARAAVRIAVLDRAADAGWTAVAAYLPLRTEPGSHELLDGLVQLGIRVLVPVTMPDHDLDWIQLPGDVPLGRGAIAGADAVVVPALAVGADGTRLGRGGGSYDRALARVRAGVPIAALLYDDELLGHVPNEPWDLPVSAIVRPSYGWQDL